MAKDFKDKTAGVSFSPVVLSRSDSYTGVGDVKPEELSGYPTNSSGTISRISDASSFSEVSIQPERGASSTNPYYPTLQQPIRKQQLSYGYPSNHYPECGYPSSGNYPRSDFPGRHIYPKGRFPKNGIYPIKNDDDLTIFQSRPNSELDKFGDHYPDKAGSGVEEESESD